MSYRAIAMKDIETDPTQTVEPNQQPIERPILRAIVGAAYPANPFILKILIQTIKVHPSQIDRCNSAVVPCVLRFTFHSQYGIILKRLSWVGDRVPRGRDEESPDSAGRDAG